IHMIIKIKERENYNQFIRSLCSILAAKVRARKPHLKTLFVLRPFTRIISWGRDFKSVLNYLIINQMEARGLISRPKKTDLAALRWQLRPEAPEARC
ncbi:MAG: hypothetical protein ACAH59_03405, partial [Pseudobdellovibrionaceae bacterium]